MVYRTLSYPKISIGASSAMAPTSTQVHAPHKHRHNVWQQMWHKACMQHVVCAAQLRSPTSNAWQTDKEARQQRGTRDGET